jgi:methylglyoxal synthase
MKGNSMKRKKRIALVAHDERKGDLLEWVKYNKKKLATHKLWATGTTGGLISEHCSLDIFKLKSGPLGGDQQLGAMIANNELDILIFKIGCVYLSKNCKRHRE